MKKALIILLTLVLTAGLVGCENSTVKKAIENGKLELADHNIEKAKSHFNLAVTEDKDNQEAKEWLELIEQYNQFVEALENKEIDKAKKSLITLKENKNYLSIEVLAKEQEKTLNTITTKVKELDKKIEELVNSYDYEDENALPPETYRVDADYLLDDPDLTEKQRKKVEKFKKDAEERAEIVLAKWAEDMKKAEEEAQNNIISKEEAEVIMMEKLELDPSVAALRTDASMDQVIDGVTYYFFDKYAVTCCFAAQAYFFNSVDGTILMYSELFN